MIINFDAKELRIKRDLLRIEKEVLQAIHTDNGIPIYQYQSSILKRKKVRRVEFESPKMKLRVDVPLSNKELCRKVDEINRLVMDH